MGNQLKLVSNTRIYLDARALLDEILDIMPNFPRAHKFSVGAKRQDLGIGLIEDIAAAYIDKPNRLHHLIVFQTKFETLKTLMRIAVMKREKYHIGGKTLVMTESNGVMISEWVDNNNINNKNN